jgi:two-component system nitrate/nitrite sensor histidine kinase NarX
MAGFSAQVGAEHCYLISFDVSNAQTKLVAQHGLLDPEANDVYQQYLPTLEKVVDKAAYYSVNADDSALVFPLLQNNRLQGGLVIEWESIASTSTGPTDESTLKAISEGCPTLAIILGNLALAQAQRRHDLYDERAAISRELHDSLAQSLTYLKIQAMRLQAALDEAENSQKASEVLDELKKNLNSAYRQLRELMTTFRLTMHGKSFKMAVRDSIDEFNKYNNIAFDLNDTCPPDLLSVDEEMQILQIIRESLYNIVRHSKAQHASVSLVFNEPQLEIQIQDDGIGFDLEAEYQRHHGLIIMQERAFSLNGQLKLSGAPGEGTLIRITFEPKLTT